MNLSKIIDADVSAYKQLASEFSSNFYVRLAAKLEYLFNTKGKRGSKDDASFNLDILGNDVFVKRGASESYLQVNKKRVPAKGKGMKFVQDCIFNLFAMETNKEVSINRPEGRTAKQDRLEFKKCSGTFFPQLADKVANATGKRDFNLKGNINTQLAVTAEQAESVEKFDSSKFTLYDNGFLRYYVAKSAELHDLTDSGVSLNSALAAIFNPDEVGDAYEILARNKDFTFLNQEGSRQAVIAYEDTLFVLEYGGRVNKVIKWVNNPNNIKIK